MKNFNELQTTCPELAKRVQSVYKEIEDLIDALSTPGEATEIRHEWSFKLFQCKIALEGAMITTRLKEGC